MNEAIKKAIEGGWKYDDYCDGRGCGDRHILLDPLFWQSFGKSLGWNKNIDTGMGTYDDFNGVFTTVTIPTWQYHLHRFIDHIAEGKDPEDFFKELLTK